MTRIEASSIDALSELARKIAKHGCMRLPRPQTFMTTNEGAVGYVVDTRMMDSRVYMIQYDDNHMPLGCLIASPAAWGELAAYNVARAYRPEVPA